MSTNLHIDHIGNLILRDGKLGLFVSSQCVTPPHYGGGRVGVLSPYAYCAGDPVNYGDYNGKFPTETQAKIARWLYFQNPTRSDWEKVGAIQENTNASNSNERFYYNSYDKNGDATEHIALGHGLSVAVGSIGTLLEIGGVGMMCTVAGAAEGAAMVEVGGTINLGALGIELCTDAINGDASCAITDVTLYVLSAGMTKGVIEKVKGLEHIATDILSYGYTAAQDMLQTAISYINNREIDENEGR